MVEIDILKVRAYQRRKRIFEVERETEKEREIKMN